MPDLLDTAIQSTMLLIKKVMKCAMRTGIEKRKKQRKWISIL